MKKNLLNIITTNSVNDYIANEWIWVEDEDEKLVIIDQNKEKLDEWHRDPGSRSTRWSEYNYYSYDSLSDLSLDLVRNFTISDFIKLTELVKEQIN